MVKSAAELVATVVRGRAEGQSSGKAKLLGPLEGPFSRLKNSERTSGTGLSGKVMGWLRLVAGSAGPVETSASLTGLAGPVEGWPGETMLTVTRNEQTLDGKKTKGGIKFLENSKKSPGFKEAATVFKGNVLWRWST